VRFIPASSRSDLTAALVGLVVALATLLLAGPWLHWHAFGDG